VVDGVYRLDEGAVLDDFFHFMRELGGVDLMARVQGTAIQREMVPVVQDLLRSGLKTLLGIERMHALPALLCSDEALMRLVGFNAQHVRHGVCQRGAAKRQGPRPEGPMGPEALAKHLGQLHRRDLEAWFHGPTRAWAQAGVLGAKVTGMVDATALETTAASEGCGQVTRQRNITDTHGDGRAIEGTVDGWKPIVLLEARTKMPLAVTVVPIHAPDVRSMRALVTQARTHLAGVTRRHQGVCDRGCWDGADRWWLDQQGITCVVPAKDHMAVTVEARAPAAAGEGVTVGRRVQTVRHGPGQTAWTERRETAGVGLTGLSPDDQYGTPAPGRHHNRRDFEPNPLHAVVVRTWNGHAYGPGGTTVFLTNAPVDKPLQPFDADDARRLIEHCWIKAAKQPWDLGHPPQNTGRAVRVHVVCTVRMCAVATAYRLPCEQEATGGEPVGWRRWRRQLLEQSRDKVIVFAQEWYGIFPLAEFAWLVGVTLKDVPPGIGTLQEMLATYRLTGHD